MVRKQRIRRTSWGPEYLGIDRSNHYVFNKEEREAQDWELAPTLKEKL